MIARYCRRHWRRDRRLQRRQERMRRREKVMRWTSMGHHHHPSRDLPRNVSGDDADAKQYRMMFTAASVFGLRLSTLPCPSLAHLLHSLTPYSEGDCQDESVPLRNRMHRKVDRCSLTASMSMHFSERQALTAVARSQPTAPKNARPFSTEAACHPSPPVSHYS